MFTRNRLTTITLTLLLLHSPAFTAPASKDNAKKKKPKSTEVLLKEMRAEVATVQRALFSRRRQLMTESEEIRSLRAQIAELEGKVNEILLEDEEYTGLEDRRQRLRDELSELYRRRASELEKQAAATPEKAKSSTTPPVKKTNNATSKKTARKPTAAQKKDKK